MYRMTDEDKAEQYLSEWLEFTRPTSIPSSGRPKATPSALSVSTAATNTL